MSARNRGRGGALPKVRGRLREFDMERALRGALEVFWRRGYEGASIAELTRAMDINRPKLYAAFGNKGKLFLAAVDRYAQMREPTLAKAMEAPTARDVARILLYGTADCLAESRTPPGLFLAQTLLSCGAAAEALREELNGRRMSMFVHLKGRFQRAKAEGDLPKRADAAELARFVTVTIFGMGVLSVCGASHKELFRVAAMALRALPVACLATLLPPNGVPFPM